MEIFIERMGFFGAGIVAGLIIGLGFWRDAGVKAERLRVEHIFDVAFGTIKSGALKKVYRCFIGKLTHDQLRIELIEEVEYREREREWRQSR